MRNFSKTRINHLDSKGIEFPDIAKALSVAGSYYPNFKSWLYFTFRKEMIEGKRSIIMARAGNNLAGLSLLKHTSDEKKICTFYVLPAFRKNGIGDSLMDKSIAYLGNENIKITVGEECNPELYPLLNKKGFSIENKISGYYRSDADEYFYSLK